MTSLKSKTDEDAPQMIWVFAAPHIAEDEGGATMVAHAEHRTGALCYELKADEAQPPAPLKQCPFCGDAMEDRGYGAIHIMGEGCPLGSHAFDPRAWNTRAQITPTDLRALPEVEALIAAEREACAWTATSFLVGDPKNGIPLRGPQAKEVAEAIRKRGGARNG